MIDGIRERYDPAARLVRPHITLVFPFESVFSAEDIRRHVERSVAGIKPFALTLQGISARKSFGNYLLLDVHEGIDAIREMHERLYTGILEPFLPQWCNPECVPFDPHLTVGRIEEDDAFAAAVQAVAGVNDLFSTTVRQVAVEIIEPDGGSTIESVIRLD